MAATHKTDWFWSDWAGDQNVRRLTPAERGVWIDLLALAADGRPFGYVCDAKGRLVELEEIGRFTNCPDLRLLAELIDGIVRKGAASRDRAGRVFNRRMVRAAELSKKRAKAGKDGAEAKWGPSTGKTTRSQRLATARTKGTHTAAEWSAMQEIFGGCVKCGTRLADLHGESCTKDHITPIFQGGSDGIENIQPMCRNCNSGKGVDCTDYRQIRDPTWRERLAKRLSNLGSGEALLKPPDVETQVEVVEPGTARAGTVVPLLSDAAFTLAGRVHAALGWDRDDPRTFGGVLLAQKWLNGGWNADLCIATVTRMAPAAARRRLRGLAYFEPAIADAHANLTTPLPKGDVTHVRPTEGHHPGGAWGASRDRFRQALAGLNESVAADGTREAGGGEDAELLRPARRE